jgi:hypothetical protein
MLVVNGAWNVEPASEGSIGIAVKLQPRLGADAVNKRVFLKVETT